MQDIINTYTRIRTLKYITYTTPGTFTVYLPSVIIFMSVLAAIKLVNTSGCAKKWLLLRSFKGDIMIQSEDVCFTKTFHSAVTDVCTLQLLPIELQRLNWFCDRNGPHWSHPKQESNHHPLLAGTHNNGEKHKKVSDSSCTAYNRGVQVTNGSTYINVRKKYCKCGQVKLKVKLSHYRSGQALSVPGG
jgi:hypothetical protein